MGTNLEVTFSGLDEAGAERAFGAVVREFERLDRELSEWRPRSPVSEVNAAAGVRAVKVPDELFKIVSAALTVSRVTDGAFDITWAALRGLWNFNPGGAHPVPGDLEISRRLGLVNWRDVVLDRKAGTVFLARKGMAMGLGGIAKGYAVDSASRILYEMGLRNFIVKAGGDMRVQGEAGPGRPWRIGVRDPRRKEAIMAALPLRDISISTSGDYEHYFVKDGVLYHHIIDPRTGRPARGSRSVTIIGPDTMTTDALSTAVFVLGPKKGMGLVERLGGIEAIIVDSHGGRHLSSGLSTGGRPRREEGPGRGDHE